jgi:5-methylcytosine-specific restriction endonuclease McrA
MFNPMPKTQRIKLSAHKWRQLRDEVQRRAAQRCEVCGVWVGYDGGAPHHIVHKSQANGHDTAENLKWVCQGCHNLLHAHKINIEGEPI